MDNQYKDILYKVTDHFDYDSICKNFLKLDNDLKNKEDFLLELLKNDQRDWPSLYNVIPDKFKNDKNFVLKSLKNNGVSLKGVSINFKKDFKIVMTAVKEWGCALEYADQTLQDNEQIVNEAVQSHGMALKFANERFKKNKNIVILAINCSKWQSGGLAFQYVDEVFKKDRDICLMAMKQFPANWEFVDKSLKGDPEILEIAKTCPTYKLMQKEFGNYE